jgi:hypothetical protein
MGIKSWLAIRVRRGLVNLFSNKKKKKNKDNLKKVQRQIKSRTKVF